MIQALAMTTALFRNSSYVAINGYGGVSGVCQQTLPPLYTMSIFSECGIYTRDVRDVPEPT